MLDIKLGCFYDTPSRIVKSFIIIICCASLLAEGKDHDLRDP